MYAFKLEFSVILIILWLAIAITLINFRRKKIKKFKDSDKNFRISSSSGNIVYSVAIATLIISVPFILLL
ncbi:MAG: hypothetical protein ACRDCW_00315 [Sarcina sp.]